MKEFFRMLNTKDGRIILGLGVLSIVLSVGFYSMIGLI